MKTKETLELEKALDAAGKKKREYGCEEVTIGFLSKGHGNEIVDYMSMDADRIFRCYEIKVTLNDLKTDNKKSFYGDYNYLVVSDSLYARNPVWDNYIPPYAGILSSADLKVRRQAKKKNISDEDRQMLEDSLLRSVFWKYEKYKEASDIETVKKLQKQLDENNEMLQKIKRENERMIWTYQDYETYYRRNHQDPSFTIEQAAKKERKEAFLREDNQFSWKKTNDGFVCPVCAEKFDRITAYCPYCGSDLRMSGKGL